MFAFRAAAEAGDARKHIDERDGGERVVSSRNLMRRRGADEAVLRRDLATDLVSLLNTIDLGSTEELDGLDYVGRSVLNYGLYDVGHLTSEDEGVEDIAQDLLAALVHHEPRLRGETLNVERDSQFDDVDQKVRFNISAEMICHPLDVPVEFIAEVDVGSGKIEVTRFSVAQ